MAAQLEYARNEVMKYKDHPALLTWIIGNEANLNFRNPKVFDAINDISKMIHELDPNHYEVNVTLQIKLLHGLHEF